MRVVVQVPIGEGFSTALNSEPGCPVWKIKEVVCRLNGIKPERVCLVHGGEVVGEDRAADEFHALTLMPKHIEAAVNEEELIEEYRYLRTQFPLVKMVDLMTYEGRLRCDRGYVKELAEKEIWPFTEYVKWHEFRMVLSYLHPFKPPSVTWLTDIHHPNIIPKKKGKVCVSILGKKWLPNTKLAAVINALYFLLQDPNPYSAYPTKRCKEVAKICRMFGFPLKRRASPASVPRRR
jgi:hypothetical protein